MITESDAMVRAPAAGVGRQIGNIAKGLYARGWMPGTAGNISVRAGQTAMITASGLSKGELTADDMVTVRIADSQPLSPHTAPLSRDLDSHRHLSRHRR